MFCYGLWNNTATAVAYNRELLGLEAQLSQGSIQRENGQKAFRFTDETGSLLFEGCVQESKQTSLKTGWSLARLLGLHQTVRALKQPYLGAKVVNPISEVLPFNADAQSFVAADAPVIQFYDSAKDTIAFNPSTEAQFGFQPHFMEHFAPFRFVYLQPEKYT